MTREQPNIGAPRIGAMRHRVTLEQAVDTPGSGGSATRTWAVLGTAWAEIAPERSGTVQRHARDEAQISHRIRMRYRDTVTSADRILLGARSFRVLGVVDVGEAHRVLEFRCREDLPK